MENASEHRRSSTCNAGKLNQETMKLHISDGMIHWGPLVRACREIQPPGSSHDGYIYFPEFKRKPSGEFIPCCTRMRCDGDKSDCIREQLNKRAKLITQARSALNDKFGILKEKISALKDLMERGCGGSLETLIKRPDLNCVFSGREMESVIVIMAFIEKSVNSIIGRINCISEVTSTNYQLGCADASALKPYIVHNSEVLIDMIDKMTVVLNRRITGEAPEFSGARSTTVGRAIMAIIRASKRLSYWTWTNKFKIAAAILAGYALLSTGAAVGSAMMLGTIKAGMATDSPYN